MKEHTGMRPHDVVVLLGVLLQKNNEWYMKDLATKLLLSQSEISESLHRSMQVQLIDHQKKMVQRLNLKDFLFHGLKFVFPAIQGTIERGIPTGTSSNPFKDQVQTKIPMVWAHQQGQIEGISITPLYQKLPDACQKWDKLHHILSAVDLIRLNKSSREVNIAKEFLAQVL
jgi:hypothetical protein